MTQEKKLDPKKQAFDNAYRVTERSRRSVDILGKHINGISAEIGITVTDEERRRIPMFHVDSVRALLREIESDMGDLTILANEV